MTRSARLLQLVAILRAHRYPVSGAYLARELNISLRTLYRDIVTLQSQGAEIKGEAGLGYILKPGFILPPLMFSAEEIEALVLGAQFVASRTDASLAKAAHLALAKITDVLPPDLKNIADETTLFMAPSRCDAVGDAMTITRLAIRTECKMKISYNDLKDRVTTRTIWPFGIAFFDHAQLILAFCEKRQSFRSFRFDRLIGFTLTEQRYPKSRRSLLREWQKSINLSHQDMTGFQHS